MVRLNPAIERLVSELASKLNLDATEARRAAFVVVAYSSNWSKSKIARYLGITRARVGQRIKKFEAYHESGDWPRLTTIWIRRQPAIVHAESKHVQVAFTPEDWHSEDLANSLLNHALETSDR